MIGLTALFKNEAPYLAEWLDFHLAVGVGRFFLYNNNSTDDYLSVLKPYREVVTLTQFPDDSGRQQAKSNHDALVHHRECDWLGFLDLDEFLYPVEAPSLQAVLDKLTFENLAEVAVYRVEMVGDFETPPPGGIVRNYLWRHVHSTGWYNEQAPAPNFSKVLVKPAWVTDETENTHFIRPQYGHAYDEAGRKFDPAVGFPDECIRQLRVNHYWAKSRQEFEAKLARGESGRDWAGYSEYMRDIWNYYERYHRAPRVEDRSALRFLKETGV